MKPCSSTLILLTTILSIHFAQTCKEINNVSMTIKDSQGAWSNITVSGCIQRTSFDGKTVTEIHIKNQKLPKIGRDVIRHLVRLDVLEMKNCEIESIEAGAFRNLPAIRIVGITHNPKLTLITGGIFDVFDTIKILRLNNNNLDTITDEALSNMTLQEVNFSYNNFAEFKSVWFAYSPHIKHLYFQHNQIRKIPARAFDNMKELQNIDFSNNKIKEIGEGAFRKLSKLLSLNLRNNQLSHISTTSFPDSILVINRWDVGNNYLTNIAHKLLDKLSIKELIIDYNPFLCTCYNGLINYIKRSGIILKSGDKCNLNYLPYCISLGNVCKLPDDSSERDNLNALLSKYKSIYSKLSDKEKNCIN